MHFSFGKSIYPYNKGDQIFELPDDLSGSTIATYLKRNELKGTTIKKEGHGLKGCILYAYRVYDVDNIAFMLVPLVYKCTGFRIAVDVEPPASCIIL